MFDNVAFNSHISVVRVHFIFHRSYPDPITSPFLSFFILFRNDPSQYYEPWNKRSNWIAWGELIKYFVTQ